jgi:predicted nucleotidyltransferase
MNDIISNNITSLEKLFKEHKIEYAYIFGSAVSSDFNDDSDLDFLVKFATGLDPLKKGELWWELHDSLRLLFNREIDIITESSLKNPYFIEEINNTKKKIYG